MAATLAVVLGLAAVGGLLLLGRALRRDAAWLRDREPGPLDFVPIRSRAKRVHLGTRLTVVVALALLAVVAARRA